MTIQEEYQARLKRVQDAVNLTEPDRVPIVPQVQSFPLQMAGYTVQECMEDWRKAGEAYDVFYKKFKPDMGRGPVLFYPTQYMEAVDVKFLRWPGNQIDDPNSIYQFIDDAYMDEDEYHEAARDITKFMMNKWIPRTFTKLEAFSKLNFRSSMWFGHMQLFETMAQPDVKQAIMSAISAGEVLLDWEVYMAEYMKHLKCDFGIPNCEAGSAFAPMDLIGDSLRGTYGILTDMLEYGDEMLELIDVMTDLTIEDTIKACKGKDTPYVWFWLHKGLDLFMSNENFAKFYWPSLRKFIYALVDADLVPVLYAEGSFNSRLEYFAEVPPKKVIYNFETVDMKRAKEVLGDVACISGNVPPHMLAYGKKQDVVDYCKWLIDTCAPGGGFIMDTAVIVDNAKEENMEAMFDTTLTYGVR